MAKKYDTQKVFEKISYKPFSPKVGIAKGKKIVTRSGVLLFDWRWTLATIYRNPIVILRVAAVTLASVLRRKTLPMAKARQYGVIHSVWTAGYYHWLTESLPRALVLQESYPEAIPLLPSRRYAGYVESLQAIGIKEFAYFPDESNVSVVDPVVTECPHQFATTSAECLLKVRQKVWQYLGLDGNLEATKIVYVSRIKARGRFVKNEPELVSTLERLGAKIVCFEDLTFLQQVALMRETKLLISIHGAALTNMMFMPE